MGFLRRLAGQPSEPPNVPKPTQGAPQETEDRTIATPADGVLLDFGLPGVDAVGESHYRDGLVRQTGGPRRNGVNVYLTAALIPEPDNPYDPNAISVRIGGEVVGYLSRSDAAAYADVVSQLRGAGVVAYCKAHVMWGWDRGRDDRGDFNVRLYIDAPARQADLVEAVLAPAPADRPYANSVCPYCATPMDPLPTAKKNCPSCGQPVYVRSGPDGYRYLLRTSDIPTLDAAWAEWNEAKARGVALPEAAGPAAQPPSGAQVVATIQKLAELRDLGAITPEEYEAKKVELLGRI
jgi:hypothetical protein